MPYKDPEARREYLRKYQREWIAARRAEFFAGKACVDCGSTEQLELDHVNPAEKEHHAIWSWREDRREAEIAKCVVRCRECHTERHAAERRCCGIKGYERGCRCETCVAAKSWSNARYRLQKRGRDLHPGERLCRPSPNYSATAPGPGTYTNKEHDMTVIAILRADHPSHTPQIEGAELRLAGAQVRMTTDDGTTIEFDREEMLAFLTPASDQPFWAGLRRAA